MLQFIIGLMVGDFIGVAIMCFMQIARNSGDD